MTRGGITTYVRFTTYDTWNIIDRCQNRKTRYIYIYIYI